MIRTNTHFSCRLVASILLISLLLEGCNHSPSIPSSCDVSEEKAAQESISGESHIKTTTTTTTTVQKVVELTQGVDAQESGAFDRLHLNKFLAAIPKEEIKYGRKLGVGGAGVVFQATYQGKEVAVKQLLRASNEQIASFQKEAVIMANYRHTNLITFIGFCKNEDAFQGQYALVMEYAPGGSLASLLKSTQEISWKTRYQIALDVAEGMSYLHDCGIVHSDLKSENILLDQDGHAKVTDFGTATLKTENSTFGDWEGGTYRWMAPEIFHIQRNTKAGDVYSYGMVLWQLGARKEPFQAITAFQVSKYISEGNHEVITDDTPMEIRRVIELCWLPEPPLRKETDTAQRPEMKQVRFLIESGYASFSGLGNYSGSFVLAGNQLDSERKPEQKQEKEEKEKGKEQEYELKEVDKVVEGKVKEAENEKEGFLSRLKALEAELRNRSVRDSKQEEAIESTEKEVKSNSSFVARGIASILGRRKEGKTTKKPKLSDSQIIDQACEESKTRNGQVKLFSKDLQDLSDRLLEKIIHALNGPGLPEVTSLDLSGSNLAKVNLGCLEKLTKLTTLNLSNTQISIETLEMLKRSNLRLTNLIIRQNPLLGSIPDENLIDCTVCYQNTYFDPILHHRLGQYYERQGEMGKAAKLYLDCDDITTYLAVAELYLRGNPGDLGFDYGFKIIQSLAEQGYVEAQYVLGRFYEKPDKQIYEYMLTNKLILQGSSQVELEQLSLKKAEHWYKLASNQKHKNAANALGRLYEDMRIQVPIPYGQPRDERHQIREALKYYRMAKEAGSTTVDRTIQRLEKNVEDIIKSN